MTVVRLVRVLRAMLLGVLGLGIAVMMIGVAARERLQARTLPPGELVDVGGYRLHLHCLGTGEPTVVLESGLLDFSLVWSRVQPALGTVARTCSYDRAGLGWSEPGRGPRTGEAMVGELRTLLERAGVSGPLVVVGHSFGGMNVRLLAHRHPEQVVGVVLVDAAHEDQWQRLPQLVEARDNLARQFRWLDWFARTGLLALAPGRMPDRGLPAAAAAQYRRLLAATRFFHHAAGELSAVDASAAQVGAAASSDSLRVPVVVIRRGMPSPVPGTSDEEQLEIEHHWRGMQQDMEAGAADRVELVAAASGHDIHISEPGLVVDAVRGIVTRWRDANAVGP